MTDDELRAIEERCSKATAGPWKYEDDDGYSWVFSDQRTEDYPGAINDVIWDVTLLPEDAAFIAAAREDVPALLAEVKRLKQELFLLQVRFRAEQSTR